MTYECRSCREPEAPLPGQQCATCARLDFKSNVRGLSRGHERREDRREHEINPRRLHPKRAQRGL